MNPTDLIQREPKPTSSQAAGSIPDDFEEGMFEAIEGALATHYNATTESVERTRPDSKNVFISYRDTSGSIEDVQSYVFTYQDPVQSRAHSLATKYLQAWALLFKKKSNTEWARKKILAFNSHEELLEFMARNDLEDYVDDYYDYLQDRQAELEEDESPGIILQSLQSWAWFLIDYALPEEIPRVKLRADFVGCVRLVWRLSEDYIPNDPDNEYYGNGKGIISITFYPSFLNYISVMTGAFGEDKRRISFRGEFSHMMTKEIMDTFIKRLQSPNA